MSTRIDKLANLFLISKILKLEIRDCRDGIITDVRSKNGTYISYGTLGVKNIDICISDVDSDIILDNSKYHEFYSCLINIFEKYTISWYNIKKNSGYYTLIKELERRDLIHVWRKVETGENKFCIRFVFKNKKIK